MRGLAFVIVASSCALAVAEPLPVKHVEAVRVSVANRSQHAFGLRALPGAAGWRLELTAARDADAADIIDVTPGTPARTLTVAVVGRMLTFDPLRFTGGHVYRVALRGDKRAAWSFVYLYPDPATLKLPAKKGTERVRFDPDESGEVDDNAPARTDKGAL
jgi:hypothetical protein